MYLFSFITIVVIISYILYIVLGGLSALWVFLCKCISFMCKLVPSHFMYVAILNGIEKCHALGQHDAVAGDLK